MLDMFGPTRTIGPLWASPRSQLFTGIQALLTIFPMEFDILLLKVPFVNLHSYTMISWIWPRKALGLVEAGRTEHERGSSQGTTAHWPALPYPIMEIEWLPY